jgi:hypothetical protein
LLQTITDHTVQMIKSLGLVVVLIGFMGCQAAAQESGAGIITSSPRVNAEAAPASKGASGEWGFVSIVDLKNFLGGGVSRIEGQFTDPRGVVFSKRIVEWSDEDFQMLEKKMAELLEFERSQALAEIAKAQQNGGSGWTLDNSGYPLKKEIIDAVIAGIPKFRHLVDLTRTQVAAADAAALAEQELRDKKKREEDAARAQKQVDDEKRRELELQMVQEQSDHNRNMLILLVVVGGGLAAFVWHKFLRLRCPSCKSTGVETLAIAELDRWRGTKKVSERNSRGTNTRHVSTTYVKNEYHYRCGDCQEEWLRERKEEL